MSIRLEVENSRQTQEGGAKREKGGETGSQPSGISWHPGRLSSHRAPVTIIAALLQADPVPRKGRV